VADFDPEGNLTSQAAPRHWVRKLTPVVAAFVASVVVAIALFEMISRTLPPSGGSLMGPEPRSRWLVLREYPPNSRFWAVPSDEGWIRDGGLRPGKYWITTDSNGFVEPSKVHATADVTIVFLGGSTTECLFVDPEHRFPYRAGRILEDSLGRTVNSYNAGRSGNTTLHSLINFIGKVVPLAPDHVLLMENVNDLVVLLYYGSYWKAQGSRGIVERPDLEESAWGSVGRAARNLARAMAPNTFRLAGRLKAQLGSTAGRRNDRSPSADEFATVRGKVHGIDEPALVASYRRSLESFVVLARAWGIAPVLMTQANRFRETPDPALLKMWLNAETGIPYGTFYRLYHRLNEVTREVATTLTVPLIDLDRAIPNPDGLMYDAVHFNERGSEIAATLISQRLLEILGPNARLADVRASPVSTLPATP